MKGKKINGEGVHTLMFAIGGYAVDNQQIQGWVNELKNSNQSQLVNEVVTEITNLVKQWENLSKTSKNNVKDNNEYGSSYGLKYEKLAAIIKNDYGMEVEDLKQYLGRSQSNPQSILMPDVNSKFQQKSAAIETNLETQLLTAYDKSFEGDKPNFEKFRKELEGKNLKGNLQECFDAMKEFYKEQETTANNVKRDIKNYEKLGGLIGLTTRNRKKFSAKIRFDKFVKENSQGKGVGVV